MLGECMTYDAFVVVAAFLASFVLFSFVLPRPGSIRRIWLDLQIRYWRFKRHHSGPRRRRHAA